MKMSDAERLDIALMHIDVLEIKQVSHELLIAEFGTDWPKIVATRNVIAHSYRVIDPQLIAATTERHLMQLVAGVRSIRRGLTPPER